MPRPLPTLALAVGLLLPLAPAAAQRLATTTRGSVSAAEPDLTAVRTATSRFRDVKVALAEGYLRDPGDMCDVAEDMGRPKELGAMGIHFFRPDLLGITGPPSPRVSGTGTHTDFTHPAVLIYEPQRDGSLELVAVENLVFIKAWETAGHKAPPSFQGVAYDRMVDDPVDAGQRLHAHPPHVRRVLHLTLLHRAPGSGRRTITRRPIVQRAARASARSCACAAPSGGTALPTTVNSSR
jgi:hypothetical protein